jgi:hypothetical protein
MSGNIGLVGISVGTKYKELHAKAASVIVEARKA